MPDENKKDPGLALEVYRDTLQPAAKVAGNIVALPLQVVDAALSKPKLWVAEKQYNYERTKRLLAEKFKDTPPEKIVPPDDYVAIPALQQISYCFDSDELRNMYANLLASSMLTDKKWLVHPSYVEIIKQLCPDEARILQYMDEHALPTISLLYENENGEAMYAFKNFSNVGELAKCEHDTPFDVAKYFDNLIRLGLIEKAENRDSLGDKSLYEPLKTHKYVSSLASDTIAQRNGFSKAVIEEGYVALSSFGASFRSICLGPIKADTTN